MVKRIFVDTHWGRGHACYDPGDDRFFMVGSLTELTGYDEIYLDSSLFPDMWGQLRELVNDGKKVYYFTRPWKWKEIRERFREDLRARVGRVTKSDEGDAYILWRVYELSRIELNMHKVFRPLTIVDVELRPLLALERDLRMAKKKLEWRKSLSIYVEDELEKAERGLREVRLRLIERAKEVAPWIIETARIIGVESISGAVGVIGVLTYFKGSSYHQALRFLGLYKVRGPIGRNLKKCNGVAREYLIILAESLQGKNGVAWPPRLRDLRRVLRMVVDAAKTVRPTGGRVRAAVPSGYITSLGGPLQRGASGSETISCGSAADRPYTPPLFPQSFSFT